MYKICFFVPLDSSEKVKEAMFGAGAGRIGNYDYCCWQTLGQGQFRPLQGSRPAIGQQNKVEKLDELKIEMVCSDECIKEVVASLIESHPYETPAYEVYKLENF